MHLTLPLLVSSLLASAISAHDIPPNVRARYNAHKDICNKVLGKVGRDIYCGDIPGAIFLKGPGNLYSNMDIDCDGLDRTAGDCRDDQTGQNETAFKDQVKTFSRGAVSDLNANKVPYVVFGNDGPPKFNPQSHGMEPLSVMAVVCGNKLIYGIWGDTNGETDTGEASISLAKLCFPHDRITGNNGHEKDDVLYIGFTGRDAADGIHYDWRAKSATAFEKSIAALGNKLIARL